MHNTKIEHPFEPENRYQMELKITISESKEEFSALLRVGYGLPIRLTADKCSFLYTHHRSPGIKDEPLNQFNNYLIHARSVIENELKEDFFPVALCCIEVSYEQRPANIIKKSNISTELLFFHFESEMEDILEYLSSLRKSDACMLY